MNTLLSTLNADQAQIQSWRHHMHRHPELAFDEHQTASYIAGLLRGWGYAVTEGIGKTGVVASLKVGNGKRAIGLRADTDALAVQEMNDSEHKSTVEGKSHTCGHDGHSAMLLGAAKHLARTRNFSGTVHLIFQPAEEVMGGAPAMIKKRKTATVLTAAAFKNIKAFLFIRYFYYSTSKLRRLCANLTPALFASPRLCGATIRRGRART